jgi:hypothetical protein
LKIQLDYGSIDFMNSRFWARKALRGWVLAGWILAITFIAIGGLGSRVTAAPQDQAKPAAAGATDKTKTDLATPRTGLIVNDPRAYQGYTLLAPIMSRMVYLLDMQGRVVRTWEGEAPGNMSVYLLENGHLLRYGRLTDQTFGAGAGAAGHIQEFTFDGEPVWERNSSKSLRRAPRRAALDRAVRRRQFGFFQPSSRRC